MLVVCFVLTLTPACHRTLLNEAELGMLCMLRMNSDFVYAMKEAHPELVEEWTKKHAESFAAPLAD